jgi:hypothetical protein
MNARTIAFQAEGGSGCLSRRVTRGGKGLALYKAACLAFQQLRAHLSLHSDLPLISAALACTVTKQPSNLSPSDRTNREAAGDSGGTG